ncbi:MAG: hypothetical protein AAGD06_21090 [Acidobacteriota bacterium]
MTRTVTIGPPVDLRPSRLRLDRPQGRWWALLKPVSAEYTGYGVDLTPEVLAEVAASYDPAVDMAPLKFDHVNKGPAQGWVQAVRFDGDVLWIQPTDLSAAATEGIRGRQILRMSAEIDPEHPETGGWYLFGVALLGAASPAVLGLPHIQLSARRYRLADALEIPMDEDELDETHDDNANPEEQPEVDPTDDALEDDLDLVDDLDEDDPPDEDDADADGDDGSEDDEPEDTDAVRLSRERRALNRERKKARREVRLARRERARNTVERDVEALGARVNLGMRRAGLVGLLLTLKAAERPTSVRLARKGKDGQRRTVERPAYDVLLASLRALPDPAAGLGGDLASEDGAPAAGRDRRSAVQLARDTRLGIDGERALELQRRYPTAFGPNQTD